MCFREQCLPFSAPRGDRQATGRVSGRGGLGPAVPGHRRRLQLPEDEASGQGQDLAWGHHLADGPADLQERWGCSYCSRLHQNTRYRKGEGVPSTLGCSRISATRKVKLSLVKCHYPPPPPPHTHTHNHNVYRKDETVTTPIYPLDRNVYEKGETVITPIYPPDRNVYRKGETVTIPIYRLDRNGYRGGVTVTTRFLLWTGTSTGKVRLSPPRYTPWTRTYTGKVRLSPPRFLLWTGMCRRRWGCDHPELFTWPECVERWDY